MSKELTEQLTIDLSGGGESSAKLWVDDKGIFHFEGNAAESAKQFLKYMKEQSQHQSLMLDELIELLKQEPSAKVDRKIKAIVEKYDK